MLLIHTITSQEDEIEGLRIVPGEGSKSILYAVSPSVSLGLIVVGQPLPSAQCEGSS